MKTYTLLFTVAFQLVTLNSTSAAQAVMTKLDMSWVAKKEMILARANTQASVKYLAAQSIKQQAKRYLEMEMTYSMIDSLKPHQVPMLSLVSENKSQ